MRQTGAGDQDDFVKDLAGLFAIVKGAIADRNRYAEEIGRQRRAIKHHGELHVRLVEMLRREDRLSPDAYPSFGDTVAQVEQLVQRLQKALAEERIGRVTLEKARLLAVVAHQAFGEVGIKTPDTGFLDNPDGLAECIARLYDRFRSEVDRLRKREDALRDALDKSDSRVERQAAEIARLHAEVQELRAADANRKTRDARGQWRQDIEDRLEAIESSIAGRGVVILGARE